jgi:hypothetical protein
MRSNLLMIGRSLHQAKTNVKKSAKHKLKMPIILAPSFGDRVCSSEAFVSTRSYAK